MLYAKEKNKHSLKILRQLMPQLILFTSGSAHTGEWIQKIIDTFTLDFCENYRNF